MVNFDSITAPLPSGSPLPNHPSDTTARQIIKLGVVYDSADGIQLQRGIHGSELACLMSDNQMALGHLYRYEIRNGKIYHTRPSVVIACLTQPIDESPGPGKLVEQ